MEKKKTVSELIADRPEYKAMVKNFIAYLDGLKLKAKK